MAKQSDIEKKQKDMARQVSDPITVSVRGLVCQDLKSLHNAQTATKIAEDLEDIVEKVKCNDMTFILTLMTSQTLQLQSLSSRVALNMAEDRSLDRLESLMKLQIKIMSESRKTIMAINEVCNPKRAVFVKEANQYNHIHNSNSEKKLKNRNKLSQQLEKEVIYVDQYTEAETVTE